jgi:signal transduction histidine kinase
VRRGPTTTEQPGDAAAPAADVAPAPPSAPEPQDIPGGDEKGSATRRGSRLALRNWRVSWRLIALTAIPTVTAMAFGLARIDEQMKSAAADQRVEQLADLGNAVTRLGYALEDERDGLAGFIASGRTGVVKTPSGAPTQALNTDYAQTNAAATQVTSLARGIASNSAFPAQVQTDLAAVMDRVDDLPHYRSAATDSMAPSLTVIDDYSEAIANLYTLNDQIAQGSSDAALQNAVRALGAISRAEDEASQQRGILYAALLSGHFEPSAAAALSSAQAQQAAELAEYQSAATIDQQQRYSDTVAGTQDDNAQAMEQQAIDSGGNGGNLAVTPPPDSPRGESAAAIWNTDMTATLTQMRQVENGLVNSVIAQSRSVHSSLTREAVETGVEVLAVLIVVLMITILVARSMVRPLRKLRTGALEVAGIRLPDTVRRMSETDGAGVPLEVEPIDVDSSDEIGEVARAFDQVHREALRLAANEAALRGNVNAMFVNLSRRSQSLVERQIRLIDDLEQGEQDPERLASLFQMDHLATRMRRNSENLLVLAGHDESRRWNQPVALVDVLRAALSEIEQYERVTLNVQPGIAVRGQAVSDVVHLTAELVENATSFSAAETPVTIAGQLLSSGGVLLEITDQGVGMGAEEMGHANWRLDNPPVVDVAVSRRMGLFVVARLAARHGIRVRLRPAASGGLIALAWLPDETIMHEAHDGTPGVPREPVISPVTDGVFAAAGSGTNGGSMASVLGDAGRAVTEHEVNAARAPRFAPLRADVDDFGGLSKRIPGAGPRPGAGWATTGPLPVFRTTPRPASDTDSEPAATGPQPLFRDSEEPVAEGPVAEGPVAEGPAAEGPAGEGSAGEGSAAEGSVADEPAADEPAADALAQAAGAEAPAAFDFGIASDGDDSAFGTASHGDDSNDAEPAPRTGPSPVLGAPDSGWEAASGSGVMLSSANGNGEGHRLPIFEAVESDWFRRGRQVVDLPPTPEMAVGETVEGNGWTSPADEGWRAAEAVHEPSSDGITSAGLPKRVPQANLVPGAVGSTAELSSATTPVRSAAATRDRFASFQRGVREGRAAASQATSGDEENEGSA